MKLKILITPTNIVMIILVISLAVFGQQESQNLDADTFFRWFGYIGVGLAALGLASAAIYGSWKKQALLEAQALAQIRKEQLIEAELTIEKLHTKVTQLENETENLEKKNLRLQKE